MTEPTLDQQSAQPSEGSSEVKSTTCYMCACRCGINVTLRDGEVRYIEGNPNHPLNQGVICAKGASGIMKQYSPARLTRPLRRKAGAERGAAEFETISWDEAFRVMEERLSHLRATDPKKFALFTGRDQMQALTGLFAGQFGTPNYAAHGGFCSVNMAAGMIYTIGGSFWEFGGPDLERAKLFVMIGTAEDPPFQPAENRHFQVQAQWRKIHLHQPGAYRLLSAIADEWIPIRPGTDGALLLALCAELVRERLYDETFVAEYTNAWLSGQRRPAKPGVRSGGCQWQHARRQPASQSQPVVVGRQHPGGSVEPRARLQTRARRDTTPCRMGLPVRPAFALLTERLAQYTP